MVQSGSDQGDLGLIDRFNIMSRTDQLNQFFTDIDPEDNTQYCKDWFLNYSRDLALKYLGPLLITIINQIVCKIFEKMGPIKKSHTKNDETTFVFQYITVLQYFVTAGVTLIVNFNIKFTAANALAILDGEYKEFSVQWYRAIG